MPLRHIGRSIYRFLVPSSAVMAEPALAKLFTNELPGFLAMIEPTTGIAWVTYTCRGGEVFNSAIVHPTASGEGCNPDDPWHEAVPVETVLKTLEGFHPEALKIVRMGNTEDGIKVHRLFRREALTSFVKGKGCVVGDAAHVMMPT
jgi:salicylate hydroxylase